MIGRNLSRGLRKIFSEQPLLYFLIGTVAISVLGNAAYQFFTNITGTSNKAVVVIALGSILILLWAAWHVERLIKFGKPANPMANESRPTPRQGLILLVSREETCRKAIQWHQQRLGWCWLICSGQTKILADKLKGELEDVNIRVEIEQVENVFNPIALKEKVEHIYENLPEKLEETDVILDFTGLSALASVGAVLACLDEKRSIQYVPAEYDRQLRPVKALDPVEIVLTWRIIHSPDASIKREQLEQSK
jgi:hypothetical protein